MDWSKNTWEKENELFSAKRKVNNQQSHYISHLSGYLYSNKMKRKVGYESLWGECLFYLYLELDTKTIRYYEQPVEVPVVSYKNISEFNVWHHIPDVLVFRQGSKPKLYQIKGGDKTTIKDEQLQYSINEACVKYALDREWTYSVIHPKELPETLKSNILTLSNFLRQRKYFDKWEEELKQKLVYKKEMPIIELAKAFSGKVDYRMILPLIYHLIAKGELRTDINININEKSIVRLGSLSDALQNFFVKET